MARTPKVQPEARPASKSSSRTTTMTFRVTDLRDLARLVGAGRVMTQMTAPVISKLKQAMARLGLPTTGV